MSTENEPKSGIFIVVYFVVPALLGFVSATEDSVPYLAAFMAVHINNLLWHIYFSNKTTQIITFSGDGAETIGCLSFVSSFLFLIGVLVGM